MSPLPISRDFLSLGWVSRVCANTGKFGMNKKLPIVKLAMRVRKAVR
jgi:hypothetical protein